MAGPDLVPPPLAALRALVAGPVGRAGGIAVFDGVPDPHICQLLALEARAAYPTSTRQVLDRGNGAVGRGGSPRRALHTAPGGRVQDAVYAAPSLHAFLGRWCGTRIVPSGNRGSYSYYAQPGDFLDLHLDVDSCDVTLITILHDDTPGHAAAGGLAVYPHRFAMPLDHIRAEPDDGVHVVKARPAHSIVLLGGLVPHRVVPLDGSGQRIISALCFRAVGGTAGAG